MRTALLIPLAAAVLAFDQFTKWLVQRLMPLHAVNPVLPFLSFTHVQNTGAAFGIYPDGNVFFIVTTLVILCALAVLHRRLVRQSAVTAAGLGLLWGGALGNLADRLLRGSVTDFLDFYVKDWHWPAFNVADSAICVGVTLMILDSFREEKQVAGLRTEQ